MKDKSVVPVLAGLASLLVLISQLGGVIEGEPFAVLVAAAASLLLAICTWRLIR